MADRCAALLSVRPGDSCPYRAKNGYFCGHHERIYLRTNALECTLRLRDVQAKLERSEAKLERAEETLAQIQDMQISTAIQVRKIRRDTKSRAWRKDKLGLRGTIDPKAMTWYRDLEYINGTKVRREAAYARARKLLVV